MVSETWLVLGAGSPIARAFAHAAAQAGHDVVLAGRDTQDLERTGADITVRTGARVRVEPFDAAALETHQGFVTACRDGAHGPLSVFIAFGLMPSQDAMDQDFSLARETMMVNYVGAVSVLAHLRPVLEAQGTGRIVALGSTAGERGRRKNYVYGSTKAGLHAYLQGLRAHLFAHGVRVVTVKPGFIDTGMTWSLGLRRTASPDALAAACLRWAYRGGEVHFFPWFWAPVMALVRILPESIAKRMRR